MSAQLQGMMIMQQLLSTAKQSGSHMAAIIAATSTVLSELLICLEAAKNPDQTPEELVEAIVKAFRAQCDNAITNEIAELKLANARALRPN